MSKRQRVIPEEKVVAEVENMEGDQNVPPETRRTRSGRTVRAPAVLLDSEATVRTPGRRTRRPVHQLLPETGEENTAEPERKLESLSEEKSSMPAVPESCAAAEPAGGSEVTSSRDGHSSRPTPTETTPASPETQPQKKPHLAAGGTQKPVIPLGKPKSGRVWKNRNKQRFSALVRDKPLCSSWEKKMQAKREKQLVKRYSLQLNEEKARQKEEKRKRRQDNLKRRAENELKAEIVQVIRNTAKIKRMKKKQLRKIEKRDTLAHLQRSQMKKGKAKVQKGNADKDLT
ncbi:coiled-coil domain-containing protein 86 [Echeneis naucrates]|uniref:Coiled-coil domain-containing protein 86 n=1 Tax=Echeneis naucrates TaxID=173247 RepID=A0A665T209_ECHNA|nr:coiled-coil domain-containing protein 86 [Echeneis naucrates]